MTITSFFNATSVSVGYGSPEGKGRFIFYSGATILSSNFFCDVSRQVENFFHKYIKKVVRTIFSITFFFMC